MNTSGTESNDSSPLTHDDLDTLFSEPEREPAAVPTKKTPTCHAIARIQHNTTLMQSTLMQDLLRDVDGMDEHEVALNIEAIQSLHFDIETGLRESLPTDKAARDQLRHRYVQEEKRELNRLAHTPIAPPSLSLFQRISRALFGHPIKFD